MAGKRSILDRYVQVDVPPLIKKRILVGAERAHGGNMSDWVRKWLYRGLLNEGLLEEQELALALAGIELEQFIAYVKEKEDPLCEESA